MERRSHRSPTRRCHLSLLPRGPGQHWSCGHACLPGGREAEMSVSREKREQFLQLVSDVFLLKSVSVWYDEASTTFFRFKRTN